MCTFSLATAIGSALLLPFSIVSNEILLLYPDNYYMQWLNDSLIQGLWNYVFLFSNISLFILLPFAHFFTESEGFGSRRGIMSRLNETLILLLLLFVLVLGLTYIISGLIGYSDIALINLLKLWNYLPFLYSCVSFLGVLLLLLSTPLGFARLFSVLGELIVKPQFLRTIKEECEMITFEEMDLRRKLNNVKNESKTFLPNNFKSKSVPSIPLLFSYNLEDEFSFKQQYLNFSRGSECCTLDRYGLNKIPLELASNIERALERYEAKRKDLESQKKVSAVRRNLSYPLAMLLLLCLTVFAALLVIENTLGLLVGLKSLPISSAAQKFAVGITSLSKIGSIGALLELILILYLWCASIVGLYTFPIISRLKPKLKNTSFPTCVGNCALLLILSTALPVLARTIGITNFDLLGDFGRIKWLGNFYVVLFYNIIFLITTALTLVDKFTLTVRKELFERLETSLASYFLWKRSSSVKSMNGLSSSTKHD